MLSDYTSIFPKALPVSLARVSALDKNIFKITDNKWQPDLLRIFLTHRYISQSEKWHLSSWQIIFMALIWMCNYSMYMRNWLREKIHLCLHCIPLHPLLSLPTCVQWSLLGSIASFSSCITLFITTLGNPPNPSAEHLPLPPSLSSSSSNRMYSMSRETVPHSQMSLSRWQRDPKAPDIPGMCHRFEHPGVVHCGSMASSRGWSFCHDIMWGRGG